MTNSEEHTVVRRSNLRYALSWTLHRRHRVALVVMLLALAGAGSVLGLLRWQHPYLRWSFAAVCWLVAAFVLFRLAAAMRVRFEEGQESL